MFSFSSFVGWSGSHAYVQAIDAAAMIVNSTDFMDNSLNIYAKINMFLKLFLNLKIISTTN